MSKIKNLYMQIEGVSTEEVDMEKLKTTLKDMLRTLRRRKLQKVRLKEMISKLFHKLKSKIKLRGKLDKQMAKYQKRLQPILKDYNEKKRLKLLEQQKRLKYLHEMATESKSARRIYKKKLKAYRKHAKRFKISALKANNPVKRMTMKVQRITKKHLQVEENISKLKRELQSLIQRKRTIALKELENEIRIIRQRIGTLKRRNTAKRNTVITHQRSRESKIMDFRKESIRGKAIDEIKAPVAVAPTKVNTVENEFTEKQAKLIKIKAVVEKEPLPIGDELLVKQAKPRRSLTHFQKRKRKARRRVTPFGDNKTPSTSDESEFERSASSEKRKIRIKPKKIIRSPDISKHGEALSKTRVTIQEKLDKEQEKSTETKAEEQKHQPNLDAVSHQDLTKEELAKDMKVSIKEDRLTAYEYEKLNHLVRKALQSIYMTHSDVPPDMAILNEDILKLASKTEFKTMRDLLPFTSAQYDSMGYSMPADLPIELLQEYQRFFENFKKNIKKAKTDEPNISNLGKIIRKISEKNLDTIIEEDDYKIERETDETQKAIQNRIKIKGLAYDDASMYDKFLAEKMQIIESAETPSGTRLRKRKGTKRLLPLKRRITAPKPLLAKRKETTELPHKTVSVISEKSIRSPKSQQAMNLVQISSKYYSAISSEARTNKERPSIIDAIRDFTFQKPSLAERKESKELPQETLSVVTEKIMDSNRTTQKVSLVQIITPQKATSGMLRAASKLQKSSQKTLVFESKESKELPQETLSVINEQVKDSEKVFLVQITTPQKATSDMLRGASKLQKSSQKALVSERKKRKELPQGTLSVISEQVEESDTTKQKVPLVQITTPQKATSDMLRAASKLQKPSQKALVFERKESQELPQKTLSVATQKSVDTIDSQPEVVLRKINLQPHSVAKAKTLVFGKKESKELPQETLPVVSEQVTDSDRTKQKVSLVQFTTPRKATLDMLRAASKLQRSSQKAMVSERKESKGLPQETLSVVTQTSADTIDSQPEIVLRKIHFQPRSVAKANLDTPSTIGDNLTKQASKEKTPVRGIIDKNIGDVNKCLKDDEYPKPKEKRKHSICAMRVTKGTCCPCRRRKTK